VDGILQTLLVAGQPNLEKLFHYNRAPTPFLRGGFLQTSRRGIGVGVTRLGTGDAQCLTGKSPNDAYVSLVKVQATHANLWGVLIVGGRAALRCPDIAGYGRAKKYWQHPVSASGIPPIRFSPQR